ncbi:unnamed protein product [Rhizophagus irregularis]|nr:unnamed protein product [Rhizophagus irregularis]
MSCPKIFSGYLPELTYDIMKHFQNDFSTLHSCILVNRLWCRLAIPLLWENPFSIPTGNYNFIGIYLHNLNGDLKTKLNEYRIKDNLFHSDTLFNYSSFIKYLNTWRIISSIEKWSKNAVRTLKPQDRNFNSVSNFRRLIQMSLFKMFIDNEVNLHTLDIEIFTFYTNWNSYYDDIFESILQNHNFIQNVRNLNLYIGSSPVYTNDSYALIKNRISQVINSHQNLKKILLSYGSIPLYQSLLLTKDYNCSNTLNTITLYRVNFKVERQIIYLVFNLIENTKQSLNYLSINVIDDDLVVSNDNKECNSIILQNLGQALPPRLEYLDLNLPIKASDFEIFLKSSQDTFIEKLLINNTDGQDILPYIKEYIMKKKRVKYLAIINSFERSDDGTYDHKELFSLKDEVDEFELYNIRVQNYYDSLINMYKFIKQIN